eukprot:364789-Chlamydomonas_euryale.AAC.8
MRQVTPTLLDRIHPPPLSDSPTRPMANGTMTQRSTRYLARGTSSMTMHVGDMAPGSTTCTTSP